MEFDLSQIKFSKKDMIKDIKIPIILTKELAEDIGLHVGDGSLYSHGKETYEFSYSGNTNEKEYMHFIIELKKKLYNINKIRKYVYGNEFRVNFNSLAIATFYSNVIGLPIGKKKDIDVPNIIKNCKDKKIIVAFLRGLIDTDFCLVFKNGRKYPMLQAHFSSSSLIISLKKLFEKLGIKTSIILNSKNFDKRTNKYYISSYIWIMEKRNLQSALFLIKPRNPKYKNKIKIVGLERFS